MIGIFGANGFIGRHLVRRLAGGPERVRAVSRHIDPAFAASLPADVEVVQADLGDDLAMASALTDLRVVVQLISTSSPGLQNRYAVSDIRDNVVPQVSFLEACVAANVERYVFLSSGGTVYGQPQTLPIPETHEAKPLSSHGMTKLVVEQYIGMYGRLHDLDSVILRVANPFGPGQRFRKGQGLIPALLQRHAQGLPVRIINGGEAIRDFLYIDDLADAVALSLTAPAAAGRTINIGSGEGRRIMDVIEAVESVLGQRFAREDGGTRDSDVDANVLDITLARDLLGWSPKTPFMDGLRLTLED
ncbi:NAD-dependent epimerase/dehydratase family protein [uncultured Aureimonas sp.]|uniref:NAD-dependent epimerase/dehydratase family protein n=1 Tax=uncultured Aureimonas sp. TaxID=1604662 RepID=UPI0025F4D485|nr:NAD-dependent epimerase/dehydratase family protein [uncultured Aureimonas sp.]